MVLRIRRSIYRRGVNYGNEDQVRRRREAAGRLRTALVRPLLMADTDTSVKVSEIELHRLGALSGLPDEIILQILRTCQPHTLLRFQGVNRAARNMVLSILGFSHTCAEIKLQLSRASDNYQHLMRMVMRTVTYNAMCFLVSPGPCEGCSSPESRLRLEWCKRLCNGCFARLHVGVQRGLPDVTP
ncbi:hypothetical protein F4780DRAFT_369783 [Xylariomycetidae sp. FL0641]|nr:hypothetical protein F4780DRAFT_369783 [Xylariomycetidae sp. FL0641]